MNDSAELALQPDARQLTLPRFLADVTARHGEREAVRFGDTSITYDELAAQALLLARGLSASGVARGTHVAVHMANRPEWIVATFAVAMTGAVVIPVNTFATAAERDYILEHSDAEVLLLQKTLLKRDFLDELFATHTQLADQGPGAVELAALPDLHSVFCLGLTNDRGAVEPYTVLEERADSVPAKRIETAAHAVEPDDEAIIIYTSGTTARPKGVLHAHRAPVVQSWRFAEFMELTHDDRVWTSQPFFWTAGIAMSLGATFAAGATLLLQETFDAGAALECIASQRATTLFAWPHQEKAMAEHPDVGKYDLSRARKVEFASPLAKIVGLETDDWGTWGSYGLSETFTLFSAIPVSAPAATRAGTSGKPLPGMSVRIVDPGGGGELAPGERGEIAVKGLTFMLGYYKVDPSLYLDAEGYFRTKDGGRIDEDGYLHWTGRLSNLIKTGGANVSPAEVDEAMFDYPGIRTTVTVGIDHPTLGEAIVLCAVPSGAEPPAVEAIAAHLKDKLARYKLPRKILFFDNAEVSYTGNQKIQVDPMREAVEKRLAQERVEIAGHTYGV
jgi:acyl-CoA synthetase (AMP-forming)/AMP-acid ligase II